MSKNDINKLKTLPQKDQLTAFGTQESEETPRAQAPSYRIWVRVRGEEQAISLTKKHLKNVELVDDLKEAIKDHLDLGNVPKTRITIHRGETILEEDTPISKLYNKKNDALEVVVDGPPPATIDPDWSFSVVTSEADQILLMFDKLFIRCCNEKLELPIFKPDEDHLYYNAIQRLQIPSNPKHEQRPFLLMNDLPTTDGDVGLTDTTALEVRSQIKECLLVLGTSGSGKTRTLIELLCKKYGFYFTGLTEENPGSGDFSMMINYILPKLKNSLSDNDTYAMRYSKCLLLARIYTLNYILKSYGKISPYNWAILQLCPTFFFGKDIFEEITLKFRRIPASSLDEQLWNLTHDILDCIGLPVILDEAQELIDRFYNKFTFTTNKNETQPLYSIVIKAFTRSGICVIPSGTGLTMKSVLDITGSHIMKGATWDNESLIVIKNGFNSTDSLRNFLLKFGFPFDDHYDIMQWFIGRVRFATTFVEEWLNNNHNIKELFEKFKEDYTNPTSNKSIMVKIVNWTNKDTIRQGIRNLFKEGVCELDIISLLERAVLRNWYNGINTLTIKEEMALELFEYGIALLDTSDFSKLQISISEPFVIESALRYFKKHTDTSLYILNQMSNVDFCPSSMGLLWEQLIPEAIIKLFQNEDVHDIFKIPLLHKNWNIYKPPNAKPYVLAMCSTSNYKLPDFLENPVSSFFYPENIAGPDVVGVVCPVNSNKKYLVFIQAKFQEKNKGDVLLTTDPKKFYHTRPKKKEEKDKLLKGYEESYDKVTKLIENYDGIFRIFISYPATVKLPEEKEDKEDDTIEIENSVEWTAIIDATNCYRIFDQQHINMFNELNQPKKRKCNSQLDFNSSKKLKF